MTAPLEKQSLGRVVGLHTVVLERLTDAQRNLVVLHSILTDERDPVADHAGWTAAEAALKTLIDASRHRVWALAEPEIDAEGNPLSSNASAATDPEGETF